MTKTLAAAAAILLSLGAPVSAHRLDEYLEATLISVEQERVHAFMRLVPGVAVSPFVIWTIDTNGDGILSETEQRTYAERVLGDLSLSLDGRRLKPRLVSVVFPKTGEMKEGLGEIQIQFTADLPGGGLKRKLVFENHHQSRIAAYMVNCLVPRDKNIQVTAQNRNEDQSFYQLNYVQAGDRPDVRAWLGTLVLILSACVISLRFSLPRARGKQLQF